MLQSDSKTINIEYKLSSINTTCLKLTFTSSNYEFGYNPIQSVKYNPVYSLNGIKRTPETSDFANVYKGTYSSAENYNKGIRMN